MIWSPDTDHDLRQLVSNSGILAGLRPGAARLPTRAFGARQCRFGPWLATVARTEVLLLDDWELAALDGPTRADLMEVIDDRAGSRTTIADAILDPLLSRSHRLNLKGHSLRPGMAATAYAEDSPTEIKEPNTAR